MTTTYRSPCRRGLIAVAETLTAVTLVGGALAAAGPANALPPVQPTPPPTIVEAPPNPPNPPSTWVAVSRGYPRDANSPNDQIGGVGTGSDEHSAMIASLNDCVSKGGGNCGYMGGTQNACIALAIAGTKDDATGIGPFIYRAQQSALAQNPGGHILTAACAANAPTIVKNPGPPTAAS